MTTPHTEKILTKSGFCDLRIEVISSKKESQTVVADGIWKFYQEPELKKSIQKTRIKMI